MARDFGLIRNMNTKLRGPLRIFDHLLKIDPGYANSKSALRGTLAIFVSFMVIAPLASRFHQPPTLAFLGVLIAMLSSMIIGDATVRQQRTTLLMVPFSSGLSLSLSIALGSLPTLQLVVFLLITFLAVALRRFGPRWFGLGFITFMAYCAPLLFPLHVASIPWAVGAVAVSIAITFVIRFVILPDTPKRLLRFYLRTFHVLSADLLQELVIDLQRFTEASNGTLGGEVRKSQARFRKFVIRLNELNLTIEQFLNSGDSPATKPQAESLMMSLFERELSLRQLLYSTSNIVSSSQARKEDLVFVATSVRSLAQRDGEIPLPPPGGSEEMKRLMESFFCAVENFVRDRSRSIEEDLTLLQIIDENSDESSVVKPSVKKAKGLHFSTRQAIQATLATGLASVIGFSVSPERWYWASIAAFVVFAGATRGDTLRRSFLRVVGTIFGLLIGFALAHMLSGYRSVEWGLVLLSIFVAIFGMRVAFGFWTATSITMMLAILYDLMGLMTTEILMLRLEETIVGAAMGAFISGLVLPTSTTASVRLNVATYLRALSQVFAVLPLDLERPAARKTLVRRLLAMDRELMNLRLTAAPVMGRVSLMKQGDLPGVLFDVSALAFFTRYLATYTGPLDGLSPEKLHLNCRRIQDESEIQACRFESESHARLSHERSSTEIPTSYGSGPTLSHVFDRVFQVMENLSQRRI